MVTANWCVGSIRGLDGVGSSLGWFASRAALRQDDSLLSRTQMPWSNPHHCLRSGLQGPMSVSRLLN